MRATGMQQKERS